MLELSRSFDGAILNFVAPEDVQRILPLITRDDGGSEIAALLPTTSTADPRRARAQARPLLNEYLNVPGYAAAQRWLGRAALLEETWRRWAMGDRREAASCIPDSVVDDLVVHGSPEECRARVDQYVSSGIATPIIDPLPGSDPMQVARDLAQR
jgi:alkanesulfonate monooxygenase SsuD/methylene tetrahydromethanopterin reductase-like flavin-dependent oxidoreductase (luciferase family)